jgi:hypothetical protein
MDTLHKGDNDDDDDNNNNNYYYYYYPQPRGLERYLAPM